MKKIFCIILIALVGCHNETISPDKNFLDEIQSYHEVHKMISTNRINLDSSSNGNLGGFFICGIGGLDGEYNSSIKTVEINEVKFMWKYQDQYLLAKFPLEKIRIKIDNNIELPKVKFVINDNDSKPYKVYGLSDNNHEPLPIHCITRQSFEENSFGWLISKIKYVEIITSEKDWPLNINLPMNER